MSKFRFREFDALGLRQRTPGDTVLNKHHVAKRKQKSKDVEVVFDVKDYKSGRAVPAPPPAGPPRPGLTSCCPDMARTNWSNLS